MQVISSLPGPMRNVEGSWRVRVHRIGRRRDDDGVLAKSLRKLVPQALAALGFEEIHCAGGDLPELLGTV